jgi:hypothetical protein
VTVTVCSACWCATHAMCKLRSTLLHVQLWIWVYDKYSV